MVLHCYTVASLPLFRAKLGADRLLSLALTEYSGD